MDIFTILMYTEMIWKVSIELKPNRFLSYLISNRFITKSIRWWCLQNGISKCFDWSVTFMAKGYDYFWNCLTKSNNWEWEAYFWPSDWTSCLILKTWVLWKTHLSPFMSPSIQVLSSPPWVQFVSPSSIIWALIYGPTLFIDAQWDSKEMSYGLLQ